MGINKNEDIGQQRLKLQIEKLLPMILPALAIYRKWWWKRI